MTGWRVVAAVAGAVLAAPQPSTPAPTRPAYVRCPVVAPASPVPPRPSPPPHVAGRPTIGGAGLDTAGLAVPPGAPPLPATLSATSWLVADLDTGAVLGACGPHEGSPPASVQKLLLAETVLPRLDPAQVVEVTQADLDFERGSSAVGLVVGGHYSVETLWLGLLLQSGNDAANVLARLGGGAQGVPGTIEAMNAEAHRLGGYDTHAVTPSGLDGAGQFTSAYDLALIARADFAREDFRRYDTTARAQIPAQPPKNPRGFQIQNENDLLIRYPGALGGKTGFTDLARHTYVGAAQRGTRRLVVTLLGAEAHPIRGWQQGAALLDWAFSLPADATVGHLVAPGEADRLLHPPLPSNGPGIAPAALGNRPAKPGSALTLGGLGAAAAALGLILVVIAVVGRRRRTAYRVPVRMNRRPGPGSAAPPGPERRPVSSPARASRSRRRP
jgi:D-alanyl-D-alanine carboxypeptidase (penicillin-binding protein 5/6)